jgi:hypothetical protein
MRAFAARPLAGQLERDLQFQIVDPIEVTGETHEAHAWRAQRYRQQGLQYRGIRWADGLEGVVIWWASEPAPSPAWLAHARLWAEEVNPEYSRPWQSRQIH